MYCDIYTITFLHLIDIARNLTHYTCCLCITGFLTTILKCANEAMRH